MPCIKVGLNEWIVIDRGNNPTFTLWTAGLSGCVGVAITTQQHAFMTHIDSRTTIANWNAAVANQFLAAIGNLGNLNQVLSCEIVIGDDDATPLANAVLATLQGALNAAVNNNCDAEMTVKRTGVRTYVDPTLHHIQIQSLTSGIHQLAWGASLNSVGGAAHMAFHGFFPGGAPADV